MHLDGHMSLHSCALMGLHHTHLTPHAGTHAHTQTTTTNITNTNTTTTTNNNTSNINKIAQK